MLLSLLLSLSALITIEAQIGGSSPKIFISGTVYQGAIRLRWAPADFGIFEKGNQYGYRVTRRLIAVEGSLLASTMQEASRTTLNSPYKPLTDLQWDPISDTSDVAGVAQGAIYADDFTVSPGGDEFTEAINEGTQNESRFGFGLFAADQSFMVAGYMGLALTDAAAVSEQPNGDYSYLIEVLTPDSMNRPTGIVRIIVDMPLELPMLTGLELSTGIGVAMLSLPRGDLERYYSSFNIERSTDGGATWQRRNEEPLLFLSNNPGSERMMFHDTIEQPGISLKFRMKGHSPFDVEGPPSNIVEGVGKAAVLGIYPDLKTITEANAQLTLNWEFPAINNGDITKFQVLRSTNSEGNFVQLAELGVNVRQYTDATPSSLSNYYLVVAIDNNANPNKSLVKLAQLNDNQAPATPSDLAATVDKNGLVTITWTKNTEPDINGYRVYFSNSPDGEFAQISPTVMESNTYSQQLELKVLGKKVYYKVLATDLRENDSDYSSVVSINRPDIMAPGKPVLKKADPLPLGVDIEWINSSSVDVAYHELQRKMKNDVNWTTLKSVPIALPQQTFLDSTTTGVREFSYRVLGFDSTGNVSSSSIINVKPLRTNPDTIFQFKVFSSVEGAQKQAKLSWEYPDAATVSEFHVYRSMDGSAPHLYATIVVVPDDLNVNPVTGRAVLIYRDKEIDPTNNYQYKVLAKFSDGNSSPFSKVVNFHY